MSELFADMYFEQCQKTARLRDENGELRIRLQQCEDQRKSLLFLVRSTALSLEENHFPLLAGLLRRNIADLETDYANQAPAVRSESPTATNPQPDIGSQEREAGLSVGSQDGVSQSYCDLPKDTRLAEWDHTATKTGELR